MNKSPYFSFLPLSLPPLPPSLPSPSPFPPSLHLSLSPPFFPPPSLPPIYTGPLLRTIADWKLLLQLMARAESVVVMMGTTEAEPSQHQISWTGMFGHALVTLGPVVLIKLLSEVDLSSQMSRLGPILPLLHNSLVELIAVHAQQRQATPTAG